MTTKTVYIAYDGVEFTKKEDCELYETITFVPKEVRNAMEIIKNFCIENNCPSCPLKNSCCKISPCDWEIPEVGDN